MSEKVIVHFALDTVPGMNRHRVSVWNDNGTVLSEPSAECPADLAVPDGETIFVEASVPAAPKRNRPPARDEGRWELRANADAQAVLNLGRKSTNGSGTAIEIRVDGAEQQRPPRKSS
jgi:hypothetical protein